MAIYRLTGAAETDIIDISVWSETQFGGAAGVRSERLIVTAFIDVATDPARPGSLARPELGSGVRSWHLRGSRDRARIFTATSTDRGISSSIARLGPR
jgi:toxin ParE1/3/4